MAHGVCHPHLHSSQSHRQQQTSIHQKMRSSVKFRENLNLQQFKVNQGANRKRICNFLFISSNFGRIS